LQLGIGKHAEQLTRDISVFGSVTIPSRIAAYLWQTPGTRDEDRAPARHRLKGRKTEALVVRRKGESASVSDEPTRVFISDLPYKLNALAQRRSESQGFPIVGPEARVTTHDQQAM